MRNEDTTSSVPDGHGPKLADAGRRAHYGAFYGPTGSGPVAVVYGNCQAEAVRVVLSGSPTFPFELVRIPPVHELGRPDLPFLHRLLRRCRLLLSQPVRPGYRGLPVGTDEVARHLPDGAATLRWPVLRYVGLHPWTAIIRHPARPSLDPPVVPYHDLRTIAAAAAAGRPAGRGPTRRDAFRAVAAASVAELRRREAGLDVSVSGALGDLGTGAAHVINHPGNAVLVLVARALQRAAGLTVDAADPGRVLLGDVRAPLAAEVLDALGLADAPRGEWIVKGRSYRCDEVAEAHLRWYERHPAVVDAALDRHGERMAVLRL